MLIIEMKVMDIPIMDLTLEDFLKWDSMMTMMIIIQDLRVLEEMIDLIEIMIMT